MRASAIALRRSLPVVAVCLSIMGSMALSATDEDAEPAERVIVMNSGRVLSGVATRNAGGWIVEQGNGRVQVPFEEVKFVAEDLLDAYRQQRDSVIEPTPATHVALAQWCISFRLHDEARGELRACLKRDPDHQAARKLLHRLDQILDPVAPKKLSSPTPRTSDGFLAPEVESLGGLSNEAATAFTQRIQPLLMNKCGNASCHGNAGRSESREGFRLIPVRTASNAHRMYTERNLAEVMRYIDVQDPMLSPLATIPHGSHAGVSGVFNTATGNTQLQMLRAWIKTVAKTKAAEEEELAERPSVTGKPRSAALANAGTPRAPWVQAAMATSTTPEKRERSGRVLTANYTQESDVTVAPAGDSMPVRRPKVDSSKETTNPSPKELDKPSDDAFDPDEFNRRYHGSRR